jgi:hypothetical protein
MVMAVTTIPHSPALTKEQVREAFETHFGGKYKIEKTHAWLRDFMVVKNAFVAVSVGLVQTEGETKFVHSGMAPRWWAGLLFGPLLGFLIWRGLTHEIQAFIRAAPEFKPAGELTRAA